MMTPQAAPPQIAIVASSYNASITGPMLEAARAELARRSPGTNAAVLRAPGAFELVALASSAARSGAFEAVVALGCVIRGQTSHDRYISAAVAEGLARLSAELAMPVCFGVITADSAAQARARAGGDKGNKGQEAMAAALDALAELRRLRGALAGGDLRPLMAPPPEPPADATPPVDKAAPAGASA
ncbi:MAG: 6,7-dimethyl-8-ribityllumazine synthase [Planctomycetota bacterium]